MKHLAQGTSCTSASLQIYQSLSNAALLVSNGHVTQFRKYMFNNHANSDGVNQTRAAARGEISNQSIPTLQTHGKLGNIAALMASNLQGAQAPSCHAGSDPVVIAAPAATVPPQVSTLACMKTAKRWLLHKDKRPFYANGSSRGKTDTPEDLAMLVTYEEACAAFISNPGQFSGLGFALGPDGTGWYWQGIDLDNVVENNLSHLANALPGYVEKSPSAKGCHAIGYGRHFATLGSNGSGTEAYDSGRY